MSTPLLESQAWDEIISWAKNEMNWNDEFISENREYVINTFWKNKGIEG